VRYLFRGLIRDSARPVEGHVEAASDEEAYSALGQNGVVTESLLPDPKPLDLNAELPQSPEFADALESAFDSSSSQVDFDALTDKYRGKKVWVIDRDKIRRRVATVVDAALALSAQHGEGDALAGFANAIQGLFDDNRNIASERNADSVAGVRFNGGATAAGAPGMADSRNLATSNGAAGGNGFAGAAGHPGLEGQIARLAKLVRQAESAVGAVAAAARSGGGGGGGGARRRTLAGGPKTGEEQNAVLLEIFKSNLALVRGMQEGTAPGAPAPGAALPPAEAPSIPTGDPEPAMAEAETAATASSS
jgi:hypothetical protein